MYPALRLMTNPIQAGFHQKFPEGFPPKWENVAESAKIRA